MKKNKFLIRVSVLMLIAAMTFSACGGTPDTPDPDGDSGTTQPGGDGGDNNGGDDNDDGGDGGDGGDIETPDGEIIVPIEFAGEILDKGSGVMTKTAGNDLYYVQAISLSTTEGSMPYAHGLFDNVDNLKISLDKDTTSGHWELMGAPVLKPWGHFKPDYPSFPQELIEKIVSESKIPGILGNLAASGTEIIQVHGEEHIKSGKPIFYTSADSNIQIAAHEKYFGLEKLYNLCEIAFKHAAPYNIARIIARPFIGEKKGEFTRTKNRHDYSVKPLMTTVLDKNCAAGNKVIGIGKIRDIFAAQGISEHHPASGLEEIWNTTLNQVKTAPDNSIIFPNFVDFDMLWGHRRDVNGYAQGLEYFDSRLPELFALLREDDLVFITADHGNDPTYRCNARRFC